jgi:hypothetical protein
MWYGIFMKTLHWKFFAGVLLAGVCVCVACKRENAQTGVKPVRASIGTPEGVPTEAEIANFMSRYQDPADSKKVVWFDVTFNSARLRATLMDDFRARGKIPFVVSVDFHRQEQEGNLVNLYAIMEGQAKIVVLDADGKVVDRKEEDLSALCPS